MVSLFIPDEESVDESMSEESVEIESSSESSSESDSESDYKTDDITTPEESDASTIGSDDSGDEDSEYDSDLSMESMVRGRRSNVKGAKTMQEKIHAILMSLTGKHPERIKAYCERACDLKDGLLEQIEDLGKRLPPNTLDQVIDI